MAQDALTELRLLYPGRLGLRAEEVALVLRGKTSRGSVQKVREKMKDGRYPTAHKTADGLWQMPLEDVAEIWKPTPTGSPVLPGISTNAAPSRTGCRKSDIGPRLAQLRSMQFLAQVYRLLGFQDDAQELDGQIKVIRAEGALARDVARSEEWANALRKQTPMPSQPSKDKRKGGL